MFSQFFTLRTSSIVILLLALMASNVLGQEPEVVDETIARVNRDLITRSMLKRAEEEARKELLQFCQNDKACFDKEWAKTQPKLLPTLIDDKLVSQRCDELGINVESEVNATIIELCKQNNLASLSDCQAVMEKQGISIDALKAGFRLQFQRRSLLSQEVYMPTLEKITEREKQEFYDKHQNKYAIPGEVVLSEIFIAFTPDTAAQAEAKAKEAVAEVKAGKEFSAVVKKYSDDNRASKLKSGLMPAIKDGDMIEALKQEVDKVQPGQITPILRWKNGLQILKLESRVPVKVKPFEEVANEIAYNLALEKSSDKVKEYFKKLRSKAFIKLAEAYAGALNDEN